MSEKTKTIQINPELFSLSANNTTRKQNKKTPKQPSSGPIKVKNPSSKPKNTSTLKRNLLKMFRNHYDEKYKQQEKQIQKQIREEKTTPPVQNNIVVPNHSNTDFESSLNYLQQLSEKKPSPAPVITTPTVVQTFTKPQPPRPIQNHTIRNNVGTEHVPIRTNLPPSFNIDSLPKPPPQQPMILKPPTHMVPQYGCLKNGRLPTYRTWKHNTQRNNSKIPNIPKPSADSIVQGSVPSQKLSTHMEEQLKQMSLRDQRRQKYQEPRPQTFQHKRPKQKRTLRRTFHVGKSKQHPHISVLVSNRTIRNNTNLHLSKLKNTPIHEVKKYLLKHGFIKVGSTTPTDVLRQMYESASLICGEVKNRNPDNLLYNYFNQEPEDSFAF